MTHIDKAKVLFEQKVHCSQAVFAAFALELGISEEQALKIGACFGAGMCKELLGCDLKSYIII